MCTVAPAVAGAESTGLRARTRSERPPSQAVAQWRVAASRVPTAARQLRISNRIPWPAVGAIDSGRNR